VRYPRRRHKQLHHDHRRPVAPRCIAYDAPKELRYDSPLLIPKRLPDSPNLPDNHEVRGRKRRADEGEDGDGHHTPENETLMPVLKKRSVKGIYKTKAKRM
jgi:hypothetical protein